MTESTASFAAMLPTPRPQDPNAQLLLFAIRRMAIGGLADAHAAAAMLSGFGQSYRRPLVLLRALMAELARAAERAILVAPPCCPRMTAGEGLILSSIAEAGSDPMSAIGSLSLLLGTCDCIGAYGSAEAIGQAFTDLGRPLALSPAAALPSPPR